jgi:hypothetical protein
MFPPRLFDRPWLMNVKVFDEWGMNLFTIERNGATKKIVVTKQLDGT